MFGKFVIFRTIEADINLDFPFLTQRATLALVPPNAEGLPEAARALVYLVEDETAVRAVTRLSLERADYEVVDFENAATALAAIERRCPDLVITDVIMRGIDGVEFAKRVKKRHPQMPLVFISGYAQSSMIKTVVSEDAIFLSKPFRSSDIVRAAARALARAWVVAG